MNKKLVTLHFTQGRLKFSSGHFTIFSKTQRESLHGHNYTLHVEITAALSEPGIVADYRLMEEKIVRLCEQLNWFFLVPTQSPYVDVVEDGEHYQITFNDKSMWLLKTDVVLLPLQNVTLETLAQWFHDNLMQDEAYVQKHAIQSISVKVHNGPYHAAETCCS